MNEHNSYGARHGYWDKQFTNALPLWSKGYYNNGKRIGYWQWYNKNTNTIKAEEYYL